MRMIRFTTSALPWFPAFSLLSAGCGGGAPAGGDTAGTGRGREARPAPAAEARGAGGAGGSTVRAAARDAAPADAAGAGGSTAAREPAGAAAPPAGAAPRPAGPRERRAGRGGTMGGPRRNRRRWPRRHDGSAGQGGHADHLLSRRRRRGAMTAAAENPMPRALVASAGKGPTASRSIRRGPHLLDGNGQPVGGRRLVRRSNMDGRTSSRWCPRAARTRRSRCASTGGRQALLVGPQRDAGPALERRRQRASRRW